MHIVDLVLRVTRNEQHPSWIDVMDHTLNGYCAAPREGEISFWLRVAMGFQRFALLQTNDPHRHVVLNAGTSAQQLFPLRFAARGNLFCRPASPLEGVKMLRGCLHKITRFDGAWR